MYGVVEISGHQYRVRPGDIIDVEKLSVEAGQSVEIEDVLFTGGETPRVGLPTVEGAKVVVKVIKHDKARKVIVFKRKRTSGRRVKNGHRQQYTALLVTEINDGNGSVAKIDAESKVAKKYL